MRDRDLEIKFSLDGGSFENIEIFMKAMLMNSKLFNRDRKILNSQIKKITSGLFLSSNVNNSPESICFETKTMDVYEMR